MAKPIIRIVTLGHIGVGKTTYMASLYGELQRRYSGFTLRAVDTQDHDSLKQMAQGVRKSVYPPPTARRDQYQFVLQLQNDDVLEFVWADYRGGALQELTEMEDAKLLQADLEQADGLMMLCDAHLLAQDATQLRHLRRMVVMVSHALRNAQQPLSLAIVFTKCDMVENFSESMLIHFSGLIEAINVSKQVQGALIPVSCGRRMMNVPMPLLFALFAALNHRTIHLASEIEQQLAALETMRSQNRGTARFWNQLSSMFTSDRTNDQRIVDIIQRTDEKRQTYQRLKASFDAISAWANRLIVITPEIAMVSYVVRLNQMKIFDINAASGLVDPFDAFF